MALDNYCTLTADRGMLNQCVDQEHEIKFRQRYRAIQKQNCDTHSNGKRWWSCRIATQHRRMPTMDSQSPIILLVDDDPETLELLRRLLATFTTHAEIVAVASGAAALAVTA